LYYVVASPFEAPPYLSGLRDIFIKRHSAGRLFNNRRTNFNNQNQHTPKAEKWLSGYEAAYTLKAGSEYGPPLM